MDKEQAAEYLGVSVRTLERLTASGKLKKGQAKGKTRPVVVYEKSELERVRKELEKSRPVEVFGRPNTPKPADAIGFRLDPFYVKKLEEAGAIHGMSAGEYARRLVIRGLEGQSAEADVKLLKKSLSDMFYIILVTKLGASEGEALDIVKSLTEGT